MKVSEFDYKLPSELIAQTPTAKREQSKMLVLDKNCHTISDKHFYDICELISENHLLVLNNTKVIPARLYGKKDSGAAIEVFLLKNSEGKLWEVLLKPAKRIKPETVIKISNELSCLAIKPLEQGKWLVEMNYDGDFYTVLDRCGNIPLPPYIERKMTSEELRRLDYERYQTVFAKNKGSVAAPTAGLHFTKEILNNLKNKGVDIAFVTLNVGLGTFRPVKCEDVAEHKMDSETFEIPEETAELINSAKSNGKKILAVGTTAVRTLETAYNQFGCIKPCRSCSELFIYPPYKFNVIDELITNFHLPKSTLLMLVSAFAGKEFIFKSYEHAIAECYRFYSYGDCMYIK